MNKNNKNEQWKCNNMKLKRQADGKQVAQGR